ncbi:Putative 115 kDa protein in type-1 retrotransposable element R1DM [Eumeta japonica]|uniref:115 kDa protein in type-1 retrotransposable element R1DM n=1 Tax=Eumeta variegata TaxID=151549 RepID=A0A4C1ZM32_EUMVA|nr:Putative 115 kDa protein in type-1 retrotransposable element R1DM [Eumeta japonica]
MRRGKTSGISLRKAGRCAYFGCAHTRVPRATSVLTSSPGTPPSKRRRQRITIVFRCRTQKKPIRAASLDERQQRYTEGGTGEITKRFFPRVKEAYRILSQVPMTPLLAQTLTGHGGFTQYLNRFKLKDLPYCACAPSKVQDVLHVLEECPIFARERAETEAGTNFMIARYGFPGLLNDEQNRAVLLKFCERVHKTM